MQQLSAKTQYSTPSPDERDKLLKMSHDLVSLIAQLRKDKTELDNTCQEKIRGLYCWSNWPVRPEKYYL